MTTEQDARSLSGEVANAFRSYRAGQVHEMSRLVSAVTPILWHTARSQGLAQSAAEDAVQTALLRLVEHADSIRDPQTVLGWLIVTTKRESWRLAKSRGREGGEVPMDRPDGAAGPAEVVVRQAGHRVLWAHLQSLSPRCQALLRIIAFAERPDYSAVSEALGMPVGSIGPTRGRCLAKLRETLQSDPAWGGVA